MVTIGGGRERERLERFEAIAQVLECLPWFHIVARTSLEPFGQRAVGCPGSAKNLEGRESKAARFVFHPELFDAQLDGERWEVAKWRGRVTGHAPMQRKRVGHWFAQG